MLDSGSREPLHYSVITRRAIEQGLIHTEGLTPAASMYSVFLRDARSETPRFVRHGGGFVGLKAWMPVGLVARIEEHNREVRRVLLERAKNAPPAAFETLVGELRLAIGFEDVERTRTSGDGGIDVRGVLMGVKPG